MDACTAASGVGPGSRRGYPSHSPPRPRIHPKNSSAIPTERAQGTAADKALAGPATDEVPTPPPATPPAAVPFHIYDDRTPLLQPQQQKGKTSAIKEADRSARSDGQTKEKKNKKEGRKVSRFLQKHAKELVEKESKEPNFWRARG
jgi:hypothetical protein